MDPHEVAEHWDAVYAGQALDEVSWFQSEPATSLRLLQDLPGSVLDVGAGASTLVDSLLAEGRKDVTLLDVSAAALEVTRQRLGDRAGLPGFVACDLLSWQPARTFDVWHDRAVFHFLTDPHDRHRYREVMRSAVAPGGAVVVATFAADGPVQCSGLPTARYSAGRLADELAPGWVVEHTEREHHVTPAGHVQPFTWVRLRAPS